ncbi:MAG: YlxR family protein [Gammaproteobacteria bacterium]|nr:YlxR family protein [Gammaproteobacteria bacterium]
MEKIRKVPLRKCVVSRERLEKKSLFRIIKNTDGLVVYDETGKSNGRGAYLKKDKGIIEKARKTKVLDRELETQVPDSLYDELLEALEKENNE